jgi:prepilin-type N-terminal cleavage/methylation domain-containing protein
LTSLFSTPIIKVIEGLTNTLESLGMKFLHNKNGFTLIEIISVILVMGVLAAVAIPMFDSTGIDDSMAANTIQADIQYAQELAMTRDQNVSITFQRNAVTYDVPADPNGVYDLETRKLPRNVVIAHPLTTTITFNSFGEKLNPTETFYIGSGVSLSTWNPGDPPPTLPTGDLTAITVEQFTGRVTVS